MRAIVRRLRNLIVHRILGVDDTPHSIAMAVAIGWLATWLPTIGLQTVLYLALAASLRVNKIAGLPVLFVSNPVTGVPMFYAAWRLGAWAMGHLDAASAAMLEARIETLSRLSEAPFSLALWGDLTQAFFALGVDLWVGSLLFGVLCAVPSYFTTKAAVRAFRMARARRRRKRLAEAHARAAAASLDGAVTPGSADEARHALEAARLEGPDAVP